MSPELPKFDPRSGKPRKSLEALLSRYTVSSSGCWEWTGTKNPGGYGIVCLVVNGKTTTIAAPRLQWMRTRGRPAPGADICHTCDNRACINPAHLFEGSALDNMRDMIAKGRDVRVHGIEHGHAKLTDDQVRAIRADTRSNKQIAADHGITPSNVYWVKTGATWKHVA